MRVIRVSRVVLGRLGVSPVCSVDVGLAWGDIRVMFGL